MVNRKFWPINRKRCGYHSDHGHDTVDCWTLKDFLEDQMKKKNYYLKGQLTLMITEGPSRTTLGRHIVNVVIRGSKTDCPNEEYIKKVFLIEGHQQKKAKPPNNVITFSDEDYR